MSKTHTKAPASAWAKMKKPEIRQKSLLVYDSHAARYSARRAQECPCFLIFSPAFPCDKRILAEYIPKYKRKTTCHKTIYIYMEDARQKNEQENNFLLVSDADADR